MAGALARQCSSSFLGLQALLAKSETPACPTCSKLLKDRGFNAEHLALRLQDMQTRRNSPFAALVAERREQMDGAYQEDLNDPLHLLSLFPELKILSQEQFGQRLPGKVFALTAAKPNVVYHFVRQHCKSAQHVQMLANQAAKQEELNEMEGPGQGVAEEATGRPATQTVASAQENPETCPGMELTQYFGQYREDWLVWVEHTACGQGMALHKYVRDTRAGKVYVFHRMCDQKTWVKLQADEIACKRCSNEPFLKQCLRSMVKFMKKYWAALDLRARLLKSPQDREASKTQQNNVGGCWGTLRNLWISLVALECSRIFSELLWKMLCMRAMTCL